jgi:hypothetical protein
MRVGEFQGAEQVATPVFEDPERLRRHLARFLSEASGAPVTVDKLTKFPAGFSWITYGVKVSGFAMASEVILRIGPPYGLFAPYSAMPEFESLSALAASDVPAPRVYFASDDLSLLGAPFFLCEKVEGDTPLPWGSQLQALVGERRDRLAANFIDALAALHVFNWFSTPLARWGEGVTPENAAQLQIDDWHGRFQRWALRRCGPARHALSGCPSCTATIGWAIFSSEMGVFRRFSIGNLFISAIPSKISVGPFCRNTAVALPSSVGWRARRIFWRATRRGPASRSTQLH